MAHITATFIARAVAMCTARDLLRCDDGQIADIDQHESTIIAYARDGSVWKATFDKEEEE